MADQILGNSIGRYHVLDQLGKGGMATVYKAYDTRLERDVALKLIRKEAFSPEVLGRMLERFDREAKALARLSHTNIINIFDYGTYEGAPYLVMEYMPGGTLKDRLGEPMQAEDAARLLLPVAQALEHSHKEGIIHRDIKPSNILIDKNGAPKITDFGIARLLEIGETTALTATGVGVGTPEYMAPEQGLGKDVDARTDVYSLGVVFYQMVSGKKPFEADTPMAVVIKHINDPLPNPSKFVPVLSKQVEQLIFKAMAKKPENRFQDMGDLAIALERIIGGRYPEPDHSEGLEDMTRDDMKIYRQERALSNPLSKVPILVWAGMGAALVLLVGAFLISKIFAHEGAVSMQVTATHTPDSATTRTQTPTKENTQIPTITPTATLVTMPSKVSPADSMEMVYVSPGEFIMGTDDGDSDERPIHSVYLDAFWIDKTEVTNQMFAAFLNDQGNQISGGSTWLDADDEGVLFEQENGQWIPKNGYENHPVIQVTWYGARMYCQWAERRLPTEAEWEKAARGTNGRTYPWGERINCGFAQYGGCDTGTVPVNSFPNGASPYGALNMTGNVWEWVADWFSEDYYSISPSNYPDGPSYGVQRVLRGGSWFVVGKGVRTTSRDRFDPANAYFDIGFRCADSQRH